MAVWTFETLDEISTDSIPDANALIKRSGCDVLGIWGNSHRGNAIFDAESQNILASLDIPKTNGTVTTTRSNSATITSEVQGVNVLLVTRESVPNASRSDVPYLYLLAVTLKI
jgi:hypothetical protein